MLEGLAIDWDLNLDPEVMKQTLTTRGNLERVARMTDLDVMATTPAEMENLLNSLRSRTSWRTRAPSAAAQLHRCRSDARPGRRAGADRDVPGQQSRSQPREDRGRSGVSRPADRRLRARAGRGGGAPGQLQTGAPEHAARPGELSFPDGAAARRADRGGGRSGERRRARRGCVATSRPDPHRMPACRSSRPSRRSRSC